MKRYILLFLLAYQIAFSQKVIVKGKVHNSGDYPNRKVTIIVNDTINKLLKYNGLLYEKAKIATPHKGNDIHYEFNLPKWNNGLDQLHNNKNYVTETDSLGNFEIKANLTDTLFFESYTQITEKHVVADLVKKKKIKIKLKLIPCEAWPYDPGKPTKLYVFIGKKIKSWSSIPGYCNAAYLDSRTLAKYEIVKNIYGDFKKDTIQFTSYSHSSPLPQNYRPFKASFADYEYCLLYVLKYKGELVQVKYLFDDVYMTKEGKWASPLKPKGLPNTISPDLFKPEKINFITPIEFEYEDIFFKQMKENFPEQYSKISDGIITVNYGYYVEDLFEFRKTEWLKQYDFLIK